MSKEKMSLAEAREIVKNINQLTYLADIAKEAVNIVLEATEPKEEKKVYWFDKRSPYDQLDNLLSNISPQDWEESEKYSKNYDTAEERDQAREEWIKSLEKKPLFTFEGHPYFEEDKCWYFKKWNYEIVNSRARPFAGSTSFKYECESSSKIYPTREACEYDLLFWIVQNHKITLSELNYFESTQILNVVNLAKEILKLSANKEAQNEANNKD